MRIFLLETNKIPKGPGYTVPGRNKAARWPKEDGIGLGKAGIWNLLFRAGACPVSVPGAKLPVPHEGDALYVAAEMQFPAQTEIALQAWMAAGGRIAASGHPEAWRFAFPGNVSVESARHDNPYAALASLHEGIEPQLVAPPKWSYARIRKESAGPLECHGKLAAIHGERQTPRRALVTTLDDAPAFVRAGNFYYLNGNPFAALQSWMQGQEDLEPWLAWRHRLFWLDEFGAYLCRTLREQQLLPPTQEGIPGLAQTTVVLKHDLDYSRDTSYLDLENQAGVPGVHPILQDANTAFWVRKLNSNQPHESAFHYNTARYSRLLEAARHKLLNLPKRPIGPDRAGIYGDGLLKQVGWAKRHGIGIHTLHRHASFMLYPELVDALDTVYTRQTEVIGSNSFFRGQVLRWGVDHAEGMRGTYGSFPDPQFPYWFPFRLAHAADGGRMLRGWESTCMMESEPGLVEQMLNHNVDGLRQRVIVLNYHPAHATQPTFAEGGCVVWFRELLDLLKSRGAQVMTLREVFEKLDHANTRSTETG